MSKLSSIALLVTFQCNIKCKHCGLSCSPEEKDWMTLDEIYDLTNQAESVGCISIVLTGGEPTLIKHEDLLTYFRYIKKETKIQNIRIVTNGHWAKTYEKAYKILNEWKEAGLDELNVSCGEYHQEFVPIDNIGFAYKAGCDLGYSTVLLAGEFTKNTSNNKASPYDFENILQHRIIQPNELSPFIGKKHAMSVNSAVCFGRGEKYIKREDIPVIKYDDLPNTCRDTISSLSCLPDGNVNICCGVGSRNMSFLTIGNWRTEPLYTIYERANNDLITNIIKYYGLKKIKEKAISLGYNLSLKNNYTSICELCVELFTNKEFIKFLNEKWQEFDKEIVTNKIVIESTLNSESFKY